MHCQRHNSFAGFAEDDYIIITNEIFKPGRDVKIMDILLKGKDGYKHNIDKNDEQYVRQKILEIICENDID